MPKRRAKSFAVQVPTEHYFGGYDTFGRFSSYFYQIQFAREVQPRTALEIGIGNRTVCDYLARHGIKVTTCDFDKTLQPDVVADIRELPLPNKKFDVAIACEILEHIPFNDLSNALSELARVARKRVIISVPYYGIWTESIVNVTIPPLRKTLRLALRLPKFWQGIDYDTHGEHHWELGRRGYPKRRLRKLLREHFVIEKEFHPHLNQMHCFFVLQPKSQRRSTR